MATCTELMDGRKYSRDSNGAVACSRTFAVFGAQNEAGARSALELFPGYDKFPNDDTIGLKLDRMDIEARGGNSHFVITAQYSSFRGSRRTIEIERFFGWDRAKIEVDIPFCWAEQITTGSDSNQLFKVVWKADVKTITERRIRRVLNTTFTTSDTRELDVIATQENCLHNINGTYYHFIGADVQQDSTDVQKFRLTYTWEIDQGSWMPIDRTTNFAAPLQQAVMDGLVYIPLYPGADVDNQRQLVRPPYTVLDLVPSYDAGILPWVTVISPLVDLGDAWRQLPGIGNL